MSESSWQEARASRFRPDGVVGTPLHTRTAQHSKTPWYFNWDLNHVVDVYDDFLGEPGTEVFLDWAIPGTGTVFAAPATVSKLPFLELRRTAG